MTLFAIIFLLFFIPATFAQSSQGFTVTSVSLSNILHPGQSASQTQWIVTMSLNGGAQSLVGTLDNSTINYQGLTSAYPLQITGSTDPEKAFYIINNNPVQISKFTILGIQKGSITSYLNLYLEVNEAPQCPSGYFGEWDAIVPAGWQNSGTSKIVQRICIGLQTIGSKSSIPSTPNIQFATHFTFIANGKNENLDLTFDKTSATSSSGLVQANWVGSLVTGNSPPDGNQYVAINNPQSNSWIVKSSNDFATWNNLYNSLSSKYQGENSNIPTNCAGIIPNSISWAGIVDWNAKYSSLTDCVQTQIQNDISPANADGDSLLSGGTNIGNTPTSVVTYNGQNAFEIPLTNYFVTNPLITLRFSGSFLGVVIPLGTPKILSASSDCFNSGDTGMIKIQVQNIGSASGSFYSTLNNCPGVSVDSSANYAVQPGKSLEIDVPMHTSGTNQNLNQQCSVTITDYNGGGSDTSQVSICMKLANQCTPNSQIIQGNSICPCVNVNGAWQPATGDQCKSCQYGVISDGSGGWTCASSPSTNDQNQQAPTNPPITVNNGTGLFSLPSTTSVAAIVGTGAIAAVGYVLWKKNMLPLSTRPGSGSKSGTKDRVPEPSKNKKASKNEISCKECGSKNPFGNKFCTRCGKKLR